MLSSRGFLFRCVGAVVLCALSLLMLVLTAAILTKRPPPTAIAPGPEQAMSTTIVDKNDDTHVVTTDYAEAKEAGVAEDATAWATYHLDKVAAYRALLVERGLLDDE